MKKRSLILFVCVMLTLASFYDAHACMSFRLTAKDGNILIARTMEFGLDSGWKFALTPRNTSFVSPAPGGKNGVQWKNKFGYLAIVGWGLNDMVADGLNEAGLSYGALWYEPDIQWQEIKTGEENRALAQTLFGAWVLGNFATVDELKKAIDEIRIFGYVVPELHSAPPGHSIIYDSNGNCVVMEIDKGKVVLYENPLGILTNAPNFPWHLAHLRQFIGMSNENPPSKEMFGMKFIPTGHGAGFIGVPGDLTPPSRFIRLGLTTFFADQPDNSAKALNTAQHIVNSFDITRGLVNEKLPSGKLLQETTQFASFRDLKNRIFYFRTYDNPDLRKIELQKTDFGGNALKFLQMDTEAQKITDVGGQFK